MSMRAIGGDGEQATTLWGGNAAGEAGTAGSFPIAAQTYALSQDGRSFAAVRNENDQGQIEIWSAGGGASLLSIPAPSGTVILSKELEDGSTITDTITTSFDTVRSLAFSPDGSTLAAGVCVTRDEQLGVCSQNEIYLWQVSSGGPLDRFQSEHSGAILSLAYSPDGTRLASGGADAAIYLHDVKSGALLGLPLIGQGGPVTALAFSRDGSRLASGGANSLLALWNVDSAQLIGDPIAGMKSTITAVAFSPDGATLITGSDHGDLAWWLLDSWINLACKYAQRNLSHAEWAQFFAKDEYASTCPEWPQGQ
jgi:WD40 repeat protein